MGEGEGGVPQLTEALSLSLERVTAQNHMLRQRQTKHFRKLSCLELTFGRVLPWLLWFHVQI